jgi:Cu/Ag efflux pump CusA
MPCMLVNHLACIISGSRSSLMAERLVAYRVSITQVFEALEHGNANACAARRGAFGSQ